MADAAVVGSGPNGLAAAITMASAGLRVSVFEEQPRPGGGLRSHDLTGAGVVHDECAGFHPFIPVSDFHREYSARLGVELVAPGIPYAHPLDGASGATAHTSLSVTAEELGVDRDGWHTVFAPLVSRFDSVARDFLNTSSRWPSDPVGLLTLGLRGALPGTTVAKLFREPPARALWSGLVAHAISDPRGPLTSAVGIALGAAAHAAGWPVVKGGTGVLAEAMVGELSRLSATVEVNTRVTDVRELAGYDIVMLDTSPAVALEIAGAILPARTRAAYRRFRHGPGAFQVALAVEGGIPWAYGPARQAGTVHVSGSADETWQSLTAVSRGRMPERPFVLVGQQHVADPGRGSRGVVPVDLYGHVPHGYTGDATQAILRQVERFAPVMRDRIVAVRSRGTREIVAANRNFTGGDILTGAKTPRQLLHGPSPSLSPWWTGTPGLYLCSAAAAPGPGAHGMVGYLAARQALRHLRRGSPLPG